MAENTDDPLAVELNLARLGIFNKQNYILICATTGILFSVLYAYIFILHHWWYTFLILIIYVNVYIIISNKINYSLHVVNNQSFKTITCICYFLLYIYLIVFAFSY